jgi:3-hydroxy-9,10-secoandrosta-1,3,5(10)-triene-9,17-dione monooxygenase reductase component
VSEPTPPATDPVAFRSWMARWATGIAVVTTRVGEDDAGLTVNSFVSVSLHPPSVLVSLMRSVDSLPMIERSRRFAVSVLGADQRAVSERFAQTGPSGEKFRGLAVHRSPSGIALPDGTLGAVECRVASFLPVFDHVLVVGEVVWQEQGVDGRPLLFFHSGYAEPDREGRLVLPPPRST